MKKNYCVCALHRGSRIFQNTEAYYMHAGNYCPDCSAIIENKLKYYNCKSEKKKEQIGNNILRRFGIDMVKDEIRRKMFMKVLKGY